LSSPTNHNSERKDAQVDQNTLYRGAYKDVSAIVFTSNAPISGQLAMILPILANHAY
jgi:hypothetical protein